MPHVMYLCTVYSLPYIGQTRSSSVSGRTRPSYETSAADLSCPFGAVAALCDAAAAALFLTLPFSGHARHRLQTCMPHSTLLQVRKSLARVRDGGGTA